MSWSDQNPKNLRVTRFLIGRDAGQETPTKAESPMGGVTESSKPTKYSPIISSDRESTFHVHTQEPTHWEISFGEKARWGGGGFTIKEERGEGKTISESMGLSGRNSNRNDPPRHLKFYPLSICGQYARLN